MRLVDLLALLAKLGPKVQQAWPYILQIADAVQNIISLLGGTRAALGKPDPADVAQLQAAGASKDEAEKVITTLQGFERAI